ncbi:MAG: folylpolyglutamate synthase/dihydrofolate synthase family protein [Gemmataceae bacterium]
MTYDEAMQFWFGRVNYEQKTPVANDLKLDQMRHLLARLGDPHRRLRIVHVAGTKGKGSTSAMLSAILRSEGYRVGLFTSPHLMDVRERIQVDRQNISREELTALMTEIHDAASTLRSGETAPLAESLTFFEIATALGFLHFVRRRVDWTILEVGLGGRFDSTNVCTPELAAITNISFDHTKQLGSTIAAIAGEKAGIIKPGRPTVSGATAPAARDVIERIARERGSSLRQAEHDYAWTGGPSEHEALPRVEIRTWRRTWPAMEVGLLGEHQATNASLAVAAIEVLRERGSVISDRAVRDGLANVRWPARLERFGERPTLVLDCAHNVASAESLARAVDACFPKAKRRLLLFAGSRDKDLAGMLKVLSPKFDHLVLTAFRNNTRVTEPSELLEMLSADQRGKCSMTPTSEEGLHAIRAMAGPDDLIVIAGSIFLAGELWPVLDAQRNAA